MRPQRFFFLLLTALQLLSLSQPARAQMDDWIYVTPESGAFEARMPNNFTSKEHKLRIDDKTVLFQGEFTSNVEENGTNKTYMIKYEQKIGSTLSGNMIAFASASDSARYKKMADGLGGKVITDEDLQFGQFRGKDIYITYKKDQKTLGLRVRILFTDYSRIYLVSNGPADTAFSFKSKYFFDTITLFDGLATLPGKFEDEWSTIKSPHNTFSIARPEKGNPYLEKEVNFNSGVRNTVIPTISEIENASLNFIDPIIKYKMYYTVKAYLCKKPPTRSEIKNILMKDFIAKYLPNASPDSLQTEPTTIEGRTIISSQASVPTSEKYPNVNYTNLEAHYMENGNILVIQELAGPNNYVLSPLGLSLFSSFKFHPQEYTEAANTNQNSTSAVKDQGTGPTTQSKSKPESTPKKEEPPKQEPPKAN